MVFCLVLQLPQLQIALCSKRGVDEAHDEEDEDAYQCDHLLVRSAARCVECVREGEEQAVVDWVEQAMSGYEVRRS